MEHRTDFIKKMKEIGIYTTFHYIPLHSSFGGNLFGKFPNELSVTDSISEKLVRLPLYPGLNVNDVFSGLKICLNC